MHGLGYRKQRSQSYSWSISGGSGHGSAFYTFGEDLQDIMFQLVEDSHVIAMQLDNVTDYLSPQYFGAPLKYTFASLINYDVCCRPIPVGSQK